MENYHQTKEQMLKQEDMALTRQMDAEAERRAKKALPHTFENDLDTIELAELVGYTTALNDVTEWINKYLDYSNDTDQLKQAIRETILQLKQLKRKTT